MACHRTANVLMEVFHLTFKLLLVAAGWRDIQGVGLVVVFRGDCKLADVFDELLFSSCCLLLASSPRNTVKPFCNGVRNSSLHSQFFPRVFERCVGNTLSGPFLCSPLRLFLGREGAVNIE